MRYNFPRDSPQMSASPAQKSGPKMGPPKFRSRHTTRQSARFTKNARFKIEGAVGDSSDGWARLFLPKIGWVPFVLSRPLPSNPTSVTVVREADGRTYLSFVVTVIDVQQVAAGRVCGIDPGLSTYATVLSVDTSTGVETEGTIDTPMFLRRRARALARSQRTLSRKKKGSRNRVKAKIRVAVLHRKVRESVADGQSETPNACGVEVRPPETVALDVEPGRTHGGQSCAA